MSTTGKTKLQILNILDILLEYTDENSPLTAAEIIQILQKRGISAEQKSVYRDLNNLDEFLNSFTENKSFLSEQISLHHENKRGYYIKRYIQTEEMKLLIDAAAASKIIPVKNSQQIIDKLKKLMSKAVSKELAEQVFIQQRIKGNNDKVFSNILLIHKAVKENRKITFKYLKYNVNKKKVLARDGEIYKISPYSLVWNNDFYYLIGNHEKYNNLSHYRVDRMCEVKIVEEERAKNYRDVSEFNTYFDTAKYITGMFNMFTGEKCNVRLKAANHMVDVIIDNFGEEVFITKADENNFYADIKAVRSEGLISWVMQFGSEIELISPEEVRQEIKNKIEKQYELYM